MAQNSHCPDHSIPMAALVQPGDRVVTIGTGSIYTQQSTLAIFNTTVKMASNS